MFEATKELRGKGTRYPLPTRLEGLEERRKVRDRAQVENRFGAFWARMNASDDNKLDIGIKPSKWSTATSWRYITFKVGQNRDRIQNSGQFSVPKDLVIFPGQAIKIWDCPQNIRMDGHLKPRALKRWRHTIQIPVNCLFLPLQSDIRQACSSSSELGQSTLSTLESAKHALACGVQPSSIIPGFFVLWHCIRMLQSVVDSRPQHSQKTWHSKT